MYYKDVSFLLSLGTLWTKVVHFELMKAESLSELVMNMGNVLSLRRIGSYGGHSLDRGFIVIIGSNINRSRNVM
jgi:hypothetical protein